MIKFLALILFGIALLAGVVWTGFAMSVHYASPLSYILYGLLGLTAFAIVYFRSRSKRYGWALFLIAFAVVAIWYSTITPRQDRNWDIDVSRGVVASVDGNLVQLNNIRDFEWENRDKADSKWVSQTYDISKLQSVDMITSSWSNPDIAHLIVSFGFEGEDYVSFSVEIRREKGEKFNQIGGFFRQFELVLIAAKERDIVKLRTNHRQEDVRLYRVDLDKEQRETLFYSYIELAKRLEENPEFYNTITANCTTVVYAISKSISKDIPLRKELILSGRLPEYLNDLGVIKGDFETAKEQSSISELANSQPATSDFSKWIRREY